MKAPHFPNLPLYQGWGRPMRVESSVDSLVLLDGTPPEGLNGSWYKVGPDRQYPPRHGDDVFIDGEGMAHVFHFDRGTVSYRSRWIRNARFLAQEKAGRSLFGEYRNPFDKDPSARDISGGTANTNAVLCGDQILILKEDDLPYAVHPKTLETIGRFDYGGKVKAQRLSAHPKIDPVADSVLNYGNQAKGDGTLDMAFYEFDQEGNIRDEIWFDAPFAGHVHDFCFTKNYVVFAFHPLVTDLETVKRTGFFFQWRPQHGMKIAVLKRRGTAADIRWFDGPPVSFGHTVNAFEEGSTLCFDLLMSQSNVFSFHFTAEDGKRSMPDPQKLRRIKISLAGNGATYQITPEIGPICELARIDDRYLGYPYRYVWTLFGGPPSSPEAGAAQGAMAGVTGGGTDGFIDIFNGEADVGSIDRHTGAIDKYSFGPRTNVHESQFVPRTPDSPEGDGWLLTIVNRLEEHRSELAIFDALKLSAGPLALYDIGVRVRSTFHGNWVPEETFRTHRYAMSRKVSVSGV